MAFRLNTYPTKNKLQVLTLLPAISTTALLFTGCKTDTNHAASQSYSQAEPVSTPTVSVHFEDDINYGVYYEGPRLSDKPIQTLLTTDNNEITYKLAFNGFSILATIGCVKGGVQVDLEGMDGVKAYGTGFDRQDPLCNPDDTLKPLSSGLSASFLDYTMLPTIAEAR